MTCYIHRTIRQWRNLLRPLHWLGLGCAKKHKILENCKCTLISWTHGPNKVKNSKGVYHFDVNLARAFAFKFTKGKVKFIKGKCEIFVFCPFCLKISINFYFESHESNVPIDTVLLIPILLYILTFHVMSWMSQNVTKWPKMPKILIFKQNAKNTYF